MMSTTNPRRTSPITAALMLACLATLARGETPAAPIITPVVDAAPLAKANAKGAALLAKPKWKTELKLSRASLYLAGDALICMGAARVPVPGGPRGAYTYPNKTVVLDGRTGRPLWETPKMVPSPVTWSDGGLLNFQTGDGQLELLRWTAQATDGASQWKTTYAPPAAPARGPGGFPGGTFIRAVPTFADQQIITGESALVPRGGGGPGGGDMPKAPLTIRSFDRKTGKVQWETPIPVPATFASVAGVAQGRVYIQVIETEPFSAPERKMQSTKFYMALNAANGKLLWKTDANSDVLEWAFQGAMFCTLSRAGELVAHDGQTGKEAWHTALSRVCDPAKPASASLSEAKLFADNERIYAYFNDNDLKATDRANPNAKAEGGIAVFDPKSGKQTGYFNGRGLIGADNLWVVDFAVSGNLLLARISNGGCIAIDRKTLQLQWSILTNTSDIATSEGVMFVNTGPNGGESLQILAVDLGQK